ncbi:MAG: rhodanese-like domain-containing protein [Bacteroidota bacterium]
MLNTIKKLLGLEPQADFYNLIRNGAVIIDVRTESEYAAGHIKQSANIPLQKLPAQFEKLDKNKTIITCCASGIRSGSAKSLLLSNGFCEVHNAGSWANLRKYTN